VLFPRSGAGAASLRPHRMEPTVRVQRDRPENQRFAAAELPERIREHSVRRFALSDRRMQLRRPRDRRLGPPVFDYDSK